MLDPADIRPRNRHFKNCSTASTQQGCHMEFLMFKSRNFAFKAQRIHPVCQLVAKPAPTNCNQFETLAFAKLQYLEVFQMLLI